MATSYRLALRSFPRYTIRTTYQTLPCHIIRVQLPHICPRLKHLGHPQIILHVSTVWVLPPIVAPHERKDNMRTKRPPPSEHRDISFLLLVGQSPQHKIQVSAFSPSPFGRGCFRHSTLLSHPRRSLNEYFSTLIVNNCISHYLILSPTSAL